MMKENATVITLLCSYLCLEKDMKPFTPSEWGKLAEKLMEQQLEPKDLLTLSEEDWKHRLGFTTEQMERVGRLLERSGGVALALASYKDKGVEIITRADQHYPLQLKKKMGKQCPPLFYAVGEINLLQKPAIGFVGSRSVVKEDETFTQRAVGTINEKGFVVVSGGAKGVDSISAQSSIYNELGAVEFVADSLMKKISLNAMVLQQKKLLMLSAVKPEAGFSAGAAMGRNKYIYCQSEATVVVRSDFGKGGTWAGATEALKKAQCPVLCWENPQYQGNMELISLGAIGISPQWDGSFPSLTGKVEREEKSSSQQISLFE